MVNDEKIVGLIKALKQLGGYYVWMAEGEEFVIMRKKDFDSKGEETKEVQLGLMVDREADDGRNDEEEYIDQVNEQLAARYGEEEPEITEFSTEEDGMDEMGLRKKVRFEPLRGDLSPELQE